MKADEKRNLTTYTEIYYILKDSPNPKIRINSPQTARNVCENALKKIRKIVSGTKKEYLLDLLNDLTSEQTEYAKELIS